MYIGHSEKQWTNEQQTEFDNCQNPCCFINMPQSSCHSKQRVYFFLLVYAFIRHIFCIMFGSNAASAKESEQHRSDGEICPCAGFCQLKLKRQANSQFYSVKEPADSFKRRLLIKFGPARNCEDQPLPWPSRSKVWLSKFSFSINDSEQPIMQ